MTTQSPVRVLDTRPGLQIGPFGKVGSQQEITVKVAPAGTTGVVLNLTGTEPTSNTFITAWPADQPVRPNASNLNLTPGQTRPNLVMVKVSPQGTIKLFNHLGATHLVVDVVGTYATNGSNSTAGRLLPLNAPMRVLDTRITPGRHGPTTTRSYDMQAIDDATSASVAGFVMNVTATEGTAPTYLTVYPTGEPQPLASNLNVLPGENIPNLVVNKLGPVTRWRCSTSPAPSTTSSTWPPSCWPDRAPGGPTGSYRSARPLSYSGPVRGTSGWRPDGDLRA